MERQTGNTQVASFVMYIIYLGVHENGTSGDFKTERVKVEGKRIQLGACFYNL